MAIMQTKGAGRKSNAMSWLAVLVVGLVIFGLTRGIVWLWGGDATSNVVYRWLEKWNGFPGYSELEEWQRVLPAAITIVALLLIVLVASIIARKLSRDPQRVERRALALGSGALYLPAFVGGLPAVLGLISGMVTPFLGGGLISIVAVLLQRIGLTHDVRGSALNILTSCRVLTPKEIMSN